MGQYDYLFYELDKQETNWGDWCHSPQAYFRGDENIEGATMNCGFQVFTKPVYMEREPHFHREEEYLFFMGAKFPDVFSSFDAEIEICVGPSLDKLEKYTITKPTVVRLPSEMWHCPLNFKRMGKPVFFQAVMMHGHGGLAKLRKREDGSEYLEWFGGGKHNCVLHPEKRCTYCGSCFDRNPVADTIEPYWTVVEEHTPEIAQLVHELEIEPTDHGPRCPSPQCYFRGETYMKGAQYHVGFQVIAGEMPMEDPHFHMAKDEYLFFWGADPMDIFNFDVDIELYIGEDRDNMEVHHITKPTVVRIPPNMWHCPILFKNVKTPFVFQAAWLSGTWGTIVRKQDADGKYIYVYQGDNVRMCVYDQKKRCTLCGKCMKDKKRVSIEEAKNQV